MLREAGASRVWTELPRPAPTRQCGGTRMGAEPKNSVVNGYCQSHDVPNLFIVGSSVFPTVSGYPATAMISARAYRTAEYVENNAIGSVEAADSKSEAGKFLPVALMCGQDRTACGHLAWPSSGRVAKAFPVNNKSEKARVLGTRALRDLPTDVKPSCLAKVKLLADKTLVRLSRQFS
jgi:hypothetical protein